MKSMIRWFAHNSVAANLMMVLFIAGGLGALPNIFLEDMPSVDLDAIQVLVEYPGAAPEESELGVCLRIEEAVEGTPGVDEINATAVEGSCNVIIEVQLEADVAKVFDDVRNRVDGITTFPIEAEKPVVSLIQMRHGVIKLALAGEVGEQALRELGYIIRDDLVSLDGVSQVHLKMVRDYEVAIEISEETLRRHGLSFSEVANAIRRQSLDLPGGTLRTQGGEILLRTNGQAYWSEDFANIVILTRSDGTTLSLGEIANVQDTFEEVDIQARFNGKPAVLIEVEQFGKEDILLIEEKVLAYIDEMNKRLPEGVSITPYKARANYLRDRLSIISQSALGGLALVMATLALFLRFRVAIWVAASVPVSLLGALMLFPAVDYSISTMSLMAFLLVIGILVDDAIVVGESIYSYEEKGLSQIDAAVKGTQEVFVPVVFGVATTMAAFAPMTMVEGRIGKFFVVIGGTAILCLVFSLIEGLFILPAHLAHRRRSGEQRGGETGFKRWQRKFSGGLEVVAHHGYKKWLIRAVNWRYVTLAIAVSLVFLSLSLVKAGHLRYQFFPPITGDSPMVLLTMPPGTPFESMKDAVQRLEAAAEEVRSEVGESYFLTELTTIGSQQLDTTPSAGNDAAKSAETNKAAVSMEMVGSQDRDVSVKEVLDRWREKVGSIPGALQLEYISSEFSMGKAIDIELRGKDLEELREAADLIKSQLATYAHITDISDSFREGKQEVKLKLREEALPLGLTLQDLANQVRQAFYGEEVQRVQRGRDDVRVVLRYPEKERRSLGTLEDMRIRAADGTEVPFSRVAEVEVGRGFSVIQRADRMRVVHVTADVDRAQVTPEIVKSKLETVLPNLMERFPQVEYGFKGEQEERAKATQGLMVGFLTALLAIYGLLAIPLQSYTQPLIIMSVIPFGAIGALWGHLLLGWDLVFFSLLGIMALAGVVVNASLVMVHAVNRRREEGMPIQLAVITAGITRFRPIVLTSTTTFVGLLPLLSVDNPGTTFVIPMALSLAFGVAFSAVVTLFLVPSLYVVLEDLLGRGAKYAEDVEASADQLLTPGR